MREIFPARSRCSTEQLNIKYESVLSHNGYAEIKNITFAARVQTNRQRLKDLTRGQSDLAMVASYALNTLHASECLASTVPEIRGGPKI